MISEQKQQIHLLREKGYGYATIAEALGLTKNQVSAYCRRNNLSGTKAERTVSSRPDSDCCLCCGKPLTRLPEESLSSFAAMSAVLSGGTAIRIW